MSGARTASLIYDPLGRLFETSNAPLNSGGNVTRFLYDGDALIAEYDPNHTLLRSYVHGADGAADDPPVWHEGAGLSERRYLHSDERGSVTPIAGTYGQLRAPNAYDIPMILSKMDNILKANYIGAHERTSARAFDKAT